MWGLINSPLSSSHSLPPHSLHPVPLSVAETSACGAKFYEEFLPRVRPVPGCGDCTRSEYERSRHLQLNLPCTQGSARTENLCSVAEF
jgi:hypothetical protein